MIVKPSSVRVIVILFPDIVAMRDSILEGDKQLTVYSKRYTEMYSNFGFVHDKV